MCRAWPLVGTAPAPAAENRGEELVVYVMYRQCSIIIMSMYMYYTHARTCTCTYCKLQVFLAFFRKICVGAEK